MGWEGIGRGEEVGRALGIECMATVGSSAAKGSWGDQRDGIRDPMSILDPAMEFRGQLDRGGAFLAVFGVAARGQDWNAEKPGLRLDHEMGLRRENVSPHGLDEAWRAAWAQRRDETAEDDGWELVAAWESVTACKFRFQTRFAPFCEKRDAGASMWPRHSHRTTVSCSWAAAEGHGLGQPASQVGGAAGAGQGGATPAMSPRSPAANGRRPPSV